MVQEPSVVSPDALPLALEISNVGFVVSVVPAVKATAVGSAGKTTAAPFASVPENPVGKVTGAVLEAAAAKTDAVAVFCSGVALEAPTVTLAAPTGTVTGTTVSLPPPQATKAAINVRPKVHLAVLVLRMENVFI